jgi:hypothetical protein
VFKNYTLQSSTDVQDIFETKLNSRDAWGHVVSNLPNVKYRKKNVKQNFEYELDSGLSTTGNPNFLQIIKELFKGINNFSDFKELSANAQLNEGGLGKIVITKNVNKYVIEITGSHYDFRRISSAIDILYKGSLSENIILESMKSNIVSFYLNEDKKYFIYYELLNPERTIRFLNENIFDTEDYKIFLSWALKKYDNDKKSRIYPRSDKANGVDLSFYGVKYNTVDSYDYENITEIDVEILPKFNLLVFKNLITVRNYCDPVEGIDGHWTLDNIPKTVKKLFFYPLCRFNKPINFSDSKLTHLTFGEGFNQLADNLPNSITHLTLGFDFNRPVDNLPNSITHLIFKYSFNQPVNKLPSSITHLEFGMYFNHPVDKLPNSITHLTFGLTFNKLLDKLPSSLTHLTFGDYFDQPVESLPNSITHLTFGLTFNKLVDKLPSSLTHLTFGDYFDQPVESLPNSITHLTFGNYFNQLVETLPSSITHLDFGWRFNQPVDKLPSSVTHLEFGMYFNHPVDKLPSSITHLTFGTNFNQPIDSLPNSIVYLHLGNYRNYHKPLFNQVINKLPESLESLSFGREYRSKINLCNLNHLTKLVIPKEIKKYVPESLLSITKFF